MSTKRPVWTWTDAVAQASIQPLTKLVCLNIGRYFSSAGKGWRVSVKQMMEDTGLSNRSIATHLQLAEDAKLLIIKREPGPHGQRGVTTYIPCFPDGAELKREGEVEPSEPDSRGQSEPASPGPSEPASLRPSEPGSRQVSSHKEDTSQKSPPAPQKGRATRKSALPDGWALPEPYREFAKGHGHPGRWPYIDSEGEKFANWAKREGKLFADWFAAWRNWWIKACEMPAPRPDPASSPSKFSVSSVSVRDTSEPMHDYFARMKREGKLRAST